MDDGSSDHTADLAREILAPTRSLRTSVISYKSNLGKGRAVRLGLLAARADIVLFSDADLSTPITETPKLVDPINNGEFDVTFGSRAFEREANWSSSTVASRTGWPRLQPCRASRNRSSLLGYAVWFQSISHERLPTDS